MEDKDTSQEDGIGSGIFGRNPPDLEPLLKLLRGDSPIPKGVRDMLAEMIDPKSEGYLHLKLNLVDVSSKTNNSDRDLEMLRIVRHYADLMKSGLSSQVAALETGEAFGISDRKVYRYKTQVDARVRWLRGETPPR